MPGVTQVELGCRRGLFLFAGNSQSVDPMLAKVGGVYMGEKAAQILRNYFNAAAPYAKTQGGAYDNTAPMAAGPWFPSNTAP